MNADYSQSVNENGSASEQEPIWSPLVNAWVYPSQVRINPHTGQNEVMPPLVWNPTTNSWEVLAQPYAQQIFGEAHSQSYEQQVPTQDAGVTAEEQSATTHAYVTDANNYEVQQVHSAQEQSMWQENQGGGAVTDAHTHSGASAVFDEEPEADDQAVAAQRHAASSVITEAPAPDGSFPSSLGDDDSDATVLSAQPVFAVLRLDDGHTEPLRGPVILGRRPKGKEEYPDAVPLQIVDTAKSMSKIHALLRPAEDGIEVTDLTSTNGTWVVFPDGRRENVTDTHSLVAVNGCQIHFGNRHVTVEIDR